MKKEFDAVQLQRDIREKLSKEYEKNPGLRNKRLEEVREKYGIKPKVKHLAKRI